MRSERAEHNRDARGSGLWTAVGWLVFALPFGLYMVLQLATLWGLRVHFGG
jgi:hypothetical protein